MEQRQDKCERWSRPIPVKCWHTPALLLGSCRLTVAAGMFEAALLWVVPIPIWCSGYPVNKDFVTMVDSEPV
jgi:hypothetical protein